MATKKEKKEIDVSDQYVKWLSELTKKDGDVAGGKGANLAEMFNAKFPVPPAFIVTAQAFGAFIESAGLKQKIADIIEKTDVDNTAELEKNAKKIRELVHKAEMPEDMEKEIIEAYEILSTDHDVSFKEKVRGVSKDALDILRNSKEPAFVAVRSSATTEDLATASFAGQQDTYTNIKGDKQLVDAVKRCFASLYTARAVYYRHKKGFEKANALLAVVVQKMVNSDKSGVVFTKNPINMNNEIIVEAVFGLGEGIVSGKIMPDHYVVSPDLKITDKKIMDKKIAIVRQADGSEKIVPMSDIKRKEQVIPDSRILEVADIAMKIEKHYNKPQDIEFAVDTDKLYIVQSRPITTLDIEKKVSNIQGEILLTGLPASPGVASGKVKIIKTMDDLSKIKEGDVLVTKMTNPDMVVTMQRSAAVVTDEGGATAHAAIVSREMGIPCVVGADIATEKLVDGMMITVDGSQGKIYEGAGEIENVKKEVLPVVKGSKTKVKVIVDLPDFAERAAKSQCDAVGLMRIEGIIASSGKHPMYYVKNNTLDEYSKVIEKGIEGIAKYFKEVWVRSSDIRSDEYRNLLGAPKEQEVNPMLGFHGIRFSLKFKGIFEAELSAIKRVAEKYPDKKIGVMFPQVIKIQEVEEAYKLIREKYDKKNLIMGVMIETPASVQIIRKICKYAKFISFGTNDLTQYTLAIDRGNSDVQYLYDETDYSIISQIRRVIGICKEYGVETSICGQAGSKKEMVKSLVKLGIDSISVNADMAKEISEYILEIEKGGHNHMKKEKKNNILPVDNMKSIKEKIEEKKEEVVQEKIQKENSGKEGESTEIEKKDIKEFEKEEKDKKGKEEEWPDLDIGIDVFKQQ